jgi:hypothetical protein
MTPNTSSVSSGSREEIGSSNSMALGRIASARDRSPLVLAPGKASRIFAGLIDELDAAQAFLAYCHRLIPPQLAHPIGASTTLPSTVVFRRRPLASIREPSGSPSR